MNCTRGEFPYGKVGMLIGEFELNHLCQENRAYWAYSTMNEQLRDTRANVFVMLID